MDVPGSDGGRRADDDVCADWRVLAPLVNAGQVADESLSAADVRGVAGAVTVLMQHGEHVGNQCAGVAGVAAHAGSLFPAAGYLNVWCNSGSGRWPPGRGRPVSG